MSQIIRAIKTDISFGTEIIDAYKLENYRFEKRLGVTGVSQSLGYSKEWFGRLPKQGIKQLEAMREAGFDGCQIPVLVPRPQGGTAEAKTVSLRDFNKLIAYEALKKKSVKAIILLVALSESGLERVVDNAFDGLSLDWFTEKVVHYSQWTYEDLMEAIGYNRDDLKELYPDEDSDPFRLHLNYE